MLLTSFSGIDANHSLLRLLLQRPERIELGEDAVADGVPPHADALHPLAEVVPHELIVRHGQEENAVSDARPVHAERAVVYAEPAVVKIVDKRGRVEPRGQLTVVDQTEGALFELGERLSVSLLLLHEIDDFLAVQHILLGHARDYHFYYCTTGDGIALFVFYDNVRNFLLDVLLGVSTCLSAHRDSSFYNVIAFYLFYKDVKLFRKIDRRTFFLIQIH